MADSLVFALKPRLVQVFFLQAAGHPLEGGIVGRVVMNGEGQSGHFCRGMKGKAVALSMLSHVLLIIYMCDYV
jgi:hypothetical protein